jgi:very-long-chain (3R)-3-hydroxyacyl-CoA dehydratase
LRANAGRTHCWWLVVALPELRASAAVVVLILCWALADVIRYAWASLSTLGVCPRALTALRYTAFVPLYPLGAGAEVLLMALALPASRAGFRCVTMPNAWNFGFDNAGFLFAVLLAYPPVWAVLYKHMWRQRARKLGGAVSEADKKAA